MAQTYSFGEVEIRPEERRVLVGGEPAHLGARAFDVLLALIERRDRVVTKNELLDIVWPGLVVEENNLQVQVSALRKVLGPSALATIPGRGYQFVLQAPQVSLTSGATPLGNSNSQPDDEVLFGRDVDFAALSQLMAAHRLVSIVGPGGIGKTRLARQLSSRVGPQRRDGAWYVDLAALSGPHLVVPAIAQAVGLQLGQGAALAALAQGLASRDLLLLLDNCEHLVAEVAAIARTLLAEAPRLGMLTTSQEPLRLPAEQVYRLESLQVPPAETSAAQGRGYPSVQLLESRIAALDPRLNMTPALVEEAMALCRDLDGIPLALEMAAARIPVLGLKGLRSRLGDRLRLLRLDARPTDSRHTTLRATLDWSHSLLSPIERTALHRLSVFAGAFGLRAAQGVMTLGTIDEWSALDALVSLVDKSLVQVLRGDPPRYRLLESTRLYALEHLGAGGEADPVFVRHGEVMAQLAEEGLAQPYQREAIDWVRRHMPDYADFTLAFERAAARSDAMVAAPLAEMLRWLNLIAGSPYALGMRVPMVKALLPFATGSARARLLSSSCDLRQFRERDGSNLELARLRTEAWREIGDPHELYLALARLGSNYAASGDFEQARRAIDEGLALEEPTWAPRLRLRFTLMAALVPWFKADAQDMRRMGERGLAVAEAMGAAGGIASTRYLLAKVPVIEGDFERAIPLLAASIAELGRCGNSQFRGNAGSLLCGAYLQCGRLAEARAAARDAMPLATLNSYAYWLLDHVALLCALTDRHEEAATLKGYLDALYADCGEVRPPAEARSAAMTDEVLGTMAAEKQRRFRCRGAAAPEQQMIQIAMSQLEEAPR